MDKQNTGVEGRGAASVHGDPLRVPAERTRAADDASDPEAERRASQLQSEIERTRADMGETIDAIQDRLRPGNVVSRAAEGVRDATIGRMKQMTSGIRDNVPRRAADWYRGSSVIERVRDNPLPAAIAVGSLAWIAFGRRPTRDYVGPPPYERWQDPEALYSGTSHSYSSTTGDYEQDETEQPDPNARLSTSIMRQTRDAASDARDRVKAVGSATQRRVRRMARENTMTAALLAAGIGVAIGLALPETERENELMGDAKASMVNRAKSAARDAVEQVQNTAEKVQRVAGDAVSSLGDTDSAESRQRRTTTRRPARNG